VKIATVSIAKSERPALTVKASSVVNLIKSPPVLQSKTAKTISRIGGKREIRFSVFTGEIYHIRLEVKSGKEKT